MDTIEQAFHQVCKRAESATRRYVSLYRSDRGYGGPEEGGWYYTDDTLVASQVVFTAAAADRIKRKVVALAKKLTADAEEARNRRCADQVEWLEDRGLDDDYLPQPDGGERFWVAVEDEQGSFVSTGDRHYS